MTAGLYNEHLGNLVETPKDRRLNTGGRAGI
jgi:hypothetical protein